MEKIEKCAECHNTLLIRDDREECMEMCDDCYEALWERVRLMSDRDYRMRVTRAATFFASNSNSEEVRMRAFFGAVMPEVPQHKVEEFLRNTGIYRT